jgi:hypothetical protein
MTAFFMRQVAGDSSETDRQAALSITTVQMISERKVSRTPPCPALPVEIFPLLQPSCFGLSMPRWKCVQQKTLALLSVISDGLEKYRV